MQINDPVTTSKNSPVIRVNWMEWFRNSKHKKMGNGIWNRGIKNGQKISTMVARYKLNGKEYKFQSDSVHHHWYVAQINRF